MPRGECFLSSVPRTKDAINFWFILAELWEEGNTSLGSILPQDDNQEILSLANFLLGSG